MNRREFFRSAFGCCLAAPVAAIITPAAAVAAPRSSLVPIVRYPNEVYETANGSLVSAAEWAKKIAESIKAGQAVILPNRRDDAGNFEWDVAMVDRNDVAGYMPKIERQP